jgi:hypothetical protein
LAWGSCTWGCRYRFAQGAFGKLHGERTSYNGTDAAINLVEIDQRLVTLLLEQQDAQEASHDASSVEAPKQRQCMKVHSNGGEGASQEATGVVHFDCVKRMKGGSLKNFMNTGGSLQVGISQEPPMLCGIQSLVLSSCPSFLIFSLFAKDFHK